MDAIRGAHMHKVPRVRAAVVAMQITNASEQRRIQRVGDVCERLHHVVQDVATKVAVEAPVSVVGEGAQRSTADAMKPPMPNASSVSVTTRYTIDAFA